jgi:hypothetical protein
VLSESVLHERIISMKEAAGGEKKCKANDDDGVVVITSDKETLRKIRILIAQTCDRTYMRFRTQL